VSRAADGSVRVRNVGAVAALTLRLVDPRPVSEPGILSVGGDPRPLLPGEERTFAATRGLPVRVEVWNGKPVDLA